MPADRPWAVGDVQQRWNGYLDPSTGIMRNLVGAQTWDELHRRENDLVEARALELLTRPVPQTFDLDHLQARACPGRSSRRSGRPACRTHRSATPARAPPSSPAAGRRQRGHAGPDGQRSQSK